jgi:hypothetical protein
MLQRAGADGGYSGQIFEMGLLQGQVAIGDTNCEIFSGVFDGDSSVVVVDEGKDMDQVVLTCLERVSEKVPEVKSEEVFFSDKTKALRHPILDHIVSVVCKGLEVSEQIVDQLMQ